MEDNEMLETFVLAILTHTGMEHGSSQGAHNIVRHARQCVNEVRKAQLQLDGEKFAADKKASVYEN